MCDFRSRLINCNSSRGSISSSRHYYPKDKIELMGKSSSSESKSNEEKERCRDKVHNGGDWSTSPNSKSSWIPWWPRSSQSNRLFSWYSTNRTSKYMENKRGRLDFETGFVWYVHQIYFLHSFNLRWWFTSRNEKVGIDTLPCPILLPRLVTDKLPFFSFCNIIMNSPLSSIFLTSAPNLRHFQLFN